MAKIPYFAWLKGMNTNISPLIHPQDQPTILNGCNNTYKLGSICKDPGYSQIGGQINSGNSVNSLFNFIQLPTTQKMLATIDNSTDNDTELYYSTGAGWTEIAAAQAAWPNKAGINVDMESFAGYCYFVGHGTTDGYITTSSLTGTTFSTSTNVTGAPFAKYIQRYRDRLYIANCELGGTASPFRVYFSNVPAAGLITWTTATDFFDVDFSDEITGISENWDKLMVFTQYNAYMYDQSQKKKVWAYGCSANKTIKNSGPYMFWANYDGVWVSTGGQPQNVAGEVIDFIRGATPTAFFAEIIDEEYHLYVGDVTVDGISYSNCSLIYNIPLNAWRVREYLDNFKSFARYNDSGTQRLWMGDSNGEVFNKGKYTDATLVNTDDGQPIVSHFELPPIHLQDLSITKKLSEIYAFAKKAQGLKLYARVIDSNDRALTPYKPLGELKDYVNHFEVKTGDGVMLQIQGTSYDSNEYFEFLGLGIDIIKGRNL